MTMTAKEQVQRAMILKAQLKELEDLIPKAKAANNVTVKLGSKGQLVIYGMGKFPINLYLSQFNRLQEALPTIQQFIVDNKESIAVKE